jgi:large subunit ribosomal protein L22
MPHFGYSFARYNPAVHVRASAREVDVSHKTAREVCKSIVGMTIPQARSFLEDVIAFKRAVAFRRFKLKSGHRSELQGFAAGGYPVKAAAEVLKVLENLQSNAEFRGLNPDRMKILHAAAHAGRRIPGFVPRAFGRSSPSMKTLVHIELVGTEVA